MVVAATDGQMPQTREHLLLAKQGKIIDVLYGFNSIEFKEFLFFFLFSWREASSSLYQ